MCGAVSTNATGRATCVKQAQAPLRRRSTKQSRAVDMTEGPRVRARCPLFDQRAVGPDLQRRSRACTNAQPAERPSYNRVTLPCTFEYIRENDPSRVTPVATPSLGPATSRGTSARILATSRIGATHAATPSLGQAICDARPHAYGRQAASVRHTWQGLCRVRQSCKARPHALIRGDVAVQHVPTTPRARIRPDPRRSKATTHVPRPQQTS